MRMPVNSVLYNIHKYVTYSYGVDGRADASIQW